MKHKSWFNFILALDVCCWFIIFMCLSGYEVLAVISVIIAIIVLVSFFIKTLLA